MLDGDYSSSFLLPSYWIQLTMRHPIRHTMDTSPHLILSVHICNSITEAPWSRFTNCA